MRQKEVLLIIPAYNEEKNIEKVMTSTSTISAISGCASCFMTF